MIKPSEVSFSTSTEYTPSDLAQCEMDFDTAIRSAASSGKWPAIVRNARDTIPAAAIAETIRTYKSAGWTVIVPDASYGATGRDIRALIQHTDATPTPTAPAWTTCADFPPHKHKQETP